MAGPLAAVAALALSGALLAQSSATATPPTDVGDPGVLIPFPTAQEVSGVLGVDVEIRGIQPGLSQLWEGIEFDWQELPSAMLGIYWAPPHETEEPLAGVMIDVAEFETVDAAMHQVDDTMFADYPEGFETDLSGDHVFTHTFPTDDVDASFIVLRDGLVVVVVMAMTFDGGDMEAASEAIVELVLDKLHADT